MQAALSENEYARERGCRNARLRTLSLPLSLSLFLSLSLAVSLCLSDSVSARKTAWSSTVTVRTFISPLHRQCILSDGSPRTVAYWRNFRSPRNLGKLFTRPRLAPAPRSPLTTESHFYPFFSIPRFYTTDQYGRNRPHDALAACSILHVHLYNIETVF